MQTVRNVAAVAIVGLVFAIFPASFNAAPSVYPTVTTIYDPDRTWNGYVIFETIEEQGAALIDMNGNLLRQFDNITQVPGPSRILPVGEESPTRNTIYGAHRIPYEWIPQLEKPEERAVVAPDLKDFRLPAVGVRPP